MDYVGMPLWGYFAMELVELPLGYKEARKLQAGEGGIWIPFPPTGMRLFLFLKQMVK